MPINFDFKKKEAISRYAPSPTGYLHRGHVLNAIFVWGITKFFKGKVILRIEDHDQERSRKSHIQNIYDTLDWLGFEADIIVPKQSERNLRYQEVLNKLTKEYHTYNCQCNRKRLINIQKEKSEELVYDNYCRKLALPSNINNNLGIRIQLDDKDISFNNYSFVQANNLTKLINQKLIQSPFKQCGDLLLKDKKNYWTYHFAVCVDDIDQNVNLVIRGNDLLSSTGRQILLSEMIKPNLEKHFFHHQLLFNSNGEKLSKRQNDYAIINERKHQSSDSLLGEICYQIGLLSSPISIKANDIQELFAKFLT